MVVSSSSQLLNFRKMKHDFSQNVIREGKELYEKKALKEARIVQLGADSVKICGKILGNYGTVYNVHFEMDRQESEIVDSQCSCPHHADCLHLACLLLHLEEHFEALLVDYFQEREPKESPKAEEEIGEFEGVLKRAQHKVQAKKEREREKHLLEDYVGAASFMARSCLFVPEEDVLKEHGEAAFLFVPQSGSGLKQIEVQIALRLPYRAKPFYVQQLKQFLSAISSQEPVIFGPNRYVFGLDSFGPFAEVLFRAVREHLHFVESKEKGSRPCVLDREGFGEVLAEAFEQALLQPQLKCPTSDALFSLPGIFWESFEKPLEFSSQTVELGVQLELIREPQVRLLFAPELHVPPDTRHKLGEVTLLECSRPGVLFEGRYYRMSAPIKRQHLVEMEALQRVAIPEGLFGAFLENALPELMRYAKVHHDDLFEQIVTLPYPHPVRGRCELHYTQGELEAVLSFVYGTSEIPEADQSLKREHIGAFMTSQGILARNLVEENQLVRELFCGFHRDEKTGHFVANTEKKIVEFMTDIVPKFSDRIEFSCPERLTSRFVYDDTQMVMYFRENAAENAIDAELKVTGGLNGVSVEALWACVTSKKKYIVLAKSGAKGGAKAQELDDGVEKGTKKILVLRLETLAPLLQILDELHIKKIENTRVVLPLWMLVNISQERCAHLPIELKLSSRLVEMQKEVFSTPPQTHLSMPTSIKAVLRPYQKDGVNWLARLRAFSLGGILADDMGLGKTLQAIVAITQYHESHPGSQTLIICPTSLVDNWKEEFAAFQPTLRVKTITGAPNDRKELLAARMGWDVLVTSYGLVQKDLALYEKMNFGYLVLDEAQHIKNRETRNARSVKKIRACHKIVLTGTPLENSLEDLWSLFDFLMPGLLGSPEYFVARYIKSNTTASASYIEELKKKVAPFVLRRLKKDVLEDLPPISHIVYHCHLSAVQEELYASYAKSACESLTKMVEEEGYQKMRIHVLATLTRLKQICCHPAIFAKEKAEPGDSSKYEMLLDLIGGLVEGGHKTVIFSQYTKMLAILREDLKKMGIKFSYLDGSSKNRLHIVKQFNEDPDIPLFLVSLKAGGTGLNLVGADTVAHIDLWWNPAVENQATDRVWRLGQGKPVSAYKLITKGTIEEKIFALQEKKKNLQDIVQTDEEFISSLSWEEVRELLKVHTQLRGTD